MNPKRFKIPKTGFLYVIKRNGAPFNGAKFDIKLDNQIYDIIPSQRNTSISLIADIIINLDNNCIEKIQPGKELEYMDEFEKQIGLRLNELLLG